MKTAYDRMLQQEAEEWFEAMDHDTTTGYLNEHYLEEIEENKIKDEIVRE